MRIMMTMTRILLSSFTLLWLSYISFAYHQVVWGWTTVSKTSTTTNELCRIIRTTNPFIHSTTRIVPTAKGTRSGSLGGSKGGSDRDDVVVDVTATTMKKKRIPVLMLAGFLGTGKTTVLKHLLEQSSFKKYQIGVIVNDVAALNIDAKLIASSSLATADNTDNNESSTSPPPTTMIQLQNGCVCCSLQDELFMSIEQIIQQHEMNHHQMNNHEEQTSESSTLDYIIIELSGIADSMSLKNTWLLAPPYIQEIAYLDQIITLVDAVTFGTDYMTWDVVNDRPEWVQRTSSSNDNGEVTPEISSDRKVAELLVEQVESADYVLINKCDIATSEQIRVTCNVVHALTRANDNDVIESSSSKKKGKEEVKYELIEHGKMDPSKLFDSLSLLSKKKQEQESEHSHNDHDHHNHDDDNKKNDSPVKDIKGTTEDCLDPVCTDPTHSHSHSHQEHTTTTTTTSSNENAVDAEGVCTDPVCTDPTHSHSHSHSEHTTATTTSTNTKQQPLHDALNLIHFVYRANRPFHPHRLMKVLNRWPVPIKDTLDLEVLNDASQSGYEIQGVPTKQISPFVGVIRSKGFSWFAPYDWVNPTTTSGSSTTTINDDAWRHDTGMYWSHAGRQFGISMAGKWWSTIPSSTMIKYFVHNMNEYDRIIRDDFVTTEFGDRRQEIVFIGTNLNEEIITNTLNKCLLTDNEMIKYRKEVEKYNIYNMQLQQLQQQQRRG